MRTIGQKNETEQRIFLKRRGPAAKKYNECVRNAILTGKKNLFKKNLMTMSMYGEEYTKIFNASDKQIKEKIRKNLESGKVVGHYDLRSDILDSEYLSRKTESEEDRNSFLKSRMKDIFQNETTKKVVSENLSPKKALKILEEKYETTLKFNFNFFEENGTLEKNFQKELKKAQMLDMKIGNSKTNVFLSSDWEKFLEKVVRKSIEKKSTVTLKVVNNARRLFLKIKKKEERKRKIKKANSTSYSSYFGF